MQPYKAELEHKSCNSESLLHLFSVCVPVSVLAPVASGCVCVLGVVAGLGPGGLLPTSDLRLGVYKESAGPGGGYNYTTCTNTDR